MPVQTLSEALDNLYTTTWQSMKDDLVDQIFDATPFWFWMRAKGHLTPLAGHRFITRPLRYAKSDNVVFLTRGGTVTLNDKEFLTEAKYDWRYMVDSIVRFWHDDQQNRGKASIINLAKSKLLNSRDSLVDTIETRLFGAAGASQFLGLQDIVSDAGTGTVGGINSTTYTWWKSKTKDMTGLSFAVNGVDEMRTMFNNVRTAKTPDGQGADNLTDKSDIILTGQTVYEYYEDAVVENKRITNDKLGDAGFENLQFKGVPLAWSPACGTRMYFLNTNYLEFVYDPEYFFEMTEWKPIPDQVNDRAAQIMVVGELTTNRRRVQGVMHTIDTE